MVERMEGAVKRMGHHMVLVIEMDVERVLEMEQRSGIADCADTRHDDRSSD